MAQEVDVAADSFLPCSLERLTDRLGKQLTVQGPQVDPQEQWNRFVCNLRCVCALHYEAVTSKIRMVITDPEQVDSGAEAEFLTDFTDLLSAAQFVQLTSKEFAAAQEIDYEFLWPCQVDWARYDAGFLTRWRDGVGAAVASDTMPFERHLLLFARGTGMTSKTDRFIVPKINLLLERVSRWCQGRREAGAPKRDEPDSPTRAQSSIHGRQSRTRLTLDDVFPRGCFASLRHLFSKVTIREPTFEHVCLVYKELPAKAGGAVQAVRAALRLRSGIPRRRRRSRLHSIGGDPHAADQALLKPCDDPAQAACPQQVADKSLIKVLLYKDVPFGDLEGVFPHKKVELQIFHKVVFVLKIVAAVVVLGLTVRNLLQGPTEAQKSEGEGRRKGTLVLLALMLVAIAKQVVGLVLAYMGLRKQYCDAVDRWMSGRTSARDMPVVSSLVDDVRAQEVKEAVLAYFFLWQHGAVWRSLDWIDEHVEQFMLHDMGIVVDFDVQDAADKLYCLGLVDRRGDGSGLEYRLLFTPGEWLRRHPHEGLTGLRLRPRPGECTGEDRLGN